MAGWALSRGTADGAISRDAAVAILAVGALAASFWLQPPYSTVLLVSGAALLFASAILSLRGWRRRQRDHAAMLAAADLVQHDLCPSLATDRQGAVIVANKAAQTRFGNGAEIETLASALRQVFAAPAGTLHRLRERAERLGFAREDIVLRRGHLRLSVHRVGSACGFLWRLEEFPDRSGAVRGGEGIGLPMMTASKSGAILYMNDALRRLLGGRRSHLDRVFNDLPLRPGDFHEIAAADGVVRARLCTVEAPSGRREIYLLPGGEEALHSADTDEPFDHLPVPILKLDAAGKVLRSNRQAREVLAAPDVEGRYLADLVEGLGRPVGDWIADAAASEQRPKSEFVRATLPRQDVFLQISLVPMPGQGGRELVAVLSDATKLKTLEAQFVQSQKMQAIGQLAGGVAHDFNNLLTAISGHCDLLLLRHEKDDPDYADLVQIHQNTNRAASLVGQLLAFSRKQTLKPELLDFQEILDDLAHLLNRLVGERVSLNLTHAPNLKCLRGDRRQLEQVIMNLVVNARDAMPEGGEIRLRTEMRTLAEPMRRDRAEVPPGDYVVVRVADSGMGIPQDRIAKIFEPFFTTKRAGEGTGLGLSMAYGIVKQSGGFIFVDSVPGSGTEFILMFPAHDKPAPLKLDRPIELPEFQEEPGGVVLLVEDEAPVRAFAARALKLRGYSVLEAENAEEALRILEDESLHVDVFVTDVIMPGMDGPSWVAKALENRPDTRVVFVSGYAEEGFSEQQQRIPNSVFLPKPFSLGELAATVQGQIH